MAWIAALASVVGTYISNQQAQKNANKLTAGQLDLQGIQADIARALKPYAIDYYKRSQEAFDPAFQRYRSIASGAPGAAAAALAPELGSVDTKYGSVVRASRELRPRGGTSASYNADLVQRAADEKGAILSGGKQSAYQGLVQMSQLAGNLGAGAAGMSTGAAAGAGNLLQSAYNATKDANADSAKMYAEIGKALAGMVGQDGQGWYVGTQRGRG